MNDRFEVLARFIKALMRLKSASKKCLSVRYQSERECCSDRYRNSELYREKADAKWDEKWCAAEDELHEAWGDVENLVPKLRPIIVAPVGQTSDQYLLYILNVVQDVGEDQGHYVEWIGGLKVPLEDGSEDGVADADRQIQEIIDALTLQLRLIGSKENQADGAEPGEGSDDGSGSASLPAVETKNSEKDSGGHGYCFACSGSGYFVQGFGEHGYVRNLKGFEHIAALIRVPEAPVLMRELLNKNQTTPIVDARSHQPSLDRQATQALYDRLQAAKCDLEKAQKINDTVEQTHCENEIESLTSQIHADVGVGGRSRDLNSEANRLRPAIYANLARAYKALRQATPPMEKLADHFEAAISAEGLTYVYRPTSGNIHWTSDPPR